MNAIFIRAYQKKDVPAMTTIWNEVVQDGIAFPQEEFLTEETAADFFAQQTACGVAEDPATGSILGLYILHPNNIGRCGHICNTSYAVSSQSRGQHIGEKLVLDSIQQAKAHGFRILQLNAVAATNTHARHLYERIGFQPLGSIPNGFRLKSGQYETICPYYLPLSE